MSEKLPRCFVQFPNGDKAAVDKLRLAILDDDERLVTSLWTVWPANNPSKPDFYATVSGMHASHKFSFHRDVVNNSFLHEAHGKLIEQGTVPAGNSRHMIAAKIPDLPWFALRASFAEASLSKRGRELPKRKGKPVIALPRPKPGRLLEIGFLLTEHDEITINEIDFIVGHLTSGGRNLIIVGREIEHDATEFLRSVDEKLKRISATDEQLAGSDQETDFSMLFFGTGEQGEMTVTEVHNVRRRQHARANDRQGR